MYVAADYYGEAHGVYESAKSNRPASCGFQDDFRTSPKILYLICTILLKENK